jgi:hypothetical protein
MWVLAWPDFFNVAIIYVATLLKYLTQILTDLVAGHLVLGTR